MVEKLVGIASLQSDYERVRRRADRLCVALVSEITHLLSKNEITLGVPIEARVKAWPSIEEKISRKSLVLGEITDLDDLVGIRLILLFRRDLEAVNSLLQQSLYIRSAEDTALRLTDAQFGYQSQHYVAEIPQAWLSLPSYADFGGIRIEIQVRTLAQHIWAAASHKLQYKHEASVPLPLRRSIYRASALLETVDLEFDRLLQERNVYVSVQLEDEGPDAALNVEIVDAVLGEVLPEQNRQYTENYDELLKDLNHFGIDNANKLRELLRKHKDSILAEDRKHAVGEGEDFYFNYVGLAREGLRQEFGGDALVDFWKTRQD